MNQEKLAKLQAQVRIGGKVQSATIFYFFFIYLDILMNIFSHY